MLTKNAMGNLINRYKAVLKKCHLLNTFGSLAIASMLIAGSATVASANNINISGQNVTDKVVSLNADDGNPEDGDKVTTAAGSSGSFNLNIDDRNMSLDTMTIGDKLLGGDFTVTLLKGNNGTTTDITSNTLSVVADNTPGETHDTTYIISTGLTHTVNGLVSIQAHEGQAKIVVDGTLYLDTSAGGDAGTIKKGSGDISDAHLYVSGTLTASDGIVNTDLNVKEITLTLDSATVNAASLILDAASTLKLEGGENVIQGNMVANNDITIDDGNILIVEGNLAANEQVNITGADATPTASGGHTSLILQGGGTLTDLTLQKGANSGGWSGGPANLWVKGKDQVVSVLGDYVNSAGSFVTIYLGATLDIYSANTVDAFNGKTILAGGTLKTNHLLINSNVLSALSQYDDPQDGKISFDFDAGGTLEASTLEFTDVVPSVELNIPNAYIKLRTLANGFDITNITLGSQLSGFEFTGGGLIEENLTVSTYADMTISANADEIQVFRTTTLTSDLTVQGTLYVTENAIFEVQSGSNFTVTDSGLVNLKGTIDLTNTTADTIEGAYALYDKGTLKLNNLTIDTADLLLTGDPINGQILLSNPDTLLSISDTLSLSGTSELTRANIAMTSFKGDASGTRLGTESSFTFNGGGTIYNNLNVGNGSTVTIANSGLNTADRTNNAAIAGQDAIGSINPENITRLAAGVALTFEAGSKLNIAAGSLFDAAEGALTVAKDSFTEITPPIPSRNTDIFSSTFTYAEVGTDGLGILRVDESHVMGEHATILDDFWGDLVVVTQAPSMTYAEYKSFLSGAKALIQGNYATLQFVDPTNKSIEITEFDATLNELISGDTTFVDKEIRIGTGFVARGHIDVASVYGDNATDITLNSEGTFLHINGTVNDGDLFKNAGTGEIKVNAGHLFLGNADNDSFLNTDITLGGATDTTLSNLIIAGSVDMSKQTLTAHATSLENNIFVDGNNTADVHYTLGTLDIAKTNIYVADIQGDAFETKMTVSGNQGSAQSGVNLQVKGDKASFEFVSNANMALNTLYMENVTLLDGGTLTVAGGTYSDNLTTTATSMTVTGKLQAADGTVNIIGGNAEGGLLGYGAFLTVGNATLGTVNIIGGTDDDLDSGGTINPANLHITNGVATADTINLNPNQGSTSLNVSSRTAAAQLSVANLNNNGGTLNITDSLADNINTVVTVTDTYLENENTLVNLSSSNGDRGILDLSATSFGKAGADGSAYTIQSRYQFFSDGVVIADALTVESSNLQNKFHFQQAGGSALYAKDSITFTDTNKVTLDNTNMTLVTKTLNAAQAVTLANNTELVFVGGGNINANLTTANTGTISIKRNTAELGIGSPADSITTLSEKKTIHANVANSLNVAQGSTLDVTKGNLLVSSDAFADGPAAQVTQAGVEDGIGTIIINASALGFTSTDPTSLVQDADTKVKDDFWGTYDVMGLSGSMTYAQYTDYLVGGNNALIQGNNASLNLGLDVTFSDIQKYTLNELARGTHVNQSINIGTGLVNQGGMISVGSVVQDSSNPKDIIISNGTTLNLTGQDGNTALFQGNTDKKILVEYGTAVFGSAGIDATLNADIVLGDGTNSAHAMFNGNVDMSGNNISNVIGSDDSVTIQNGAKVQINEVETDIFNLTGNSELTLQSLAIKEKGSIGTLNDDATAVDGSGSLTTNKLTLNSADFIAYSGVVNITNLIMDAQSNFFTGSNVEGGQAISIIASVQGNGGWLGTDPAWNSDPALNTPSTASLQVFKSFTDRTTPNPDTRVNTKVGSFQNSLTALGTLTDGTLGGDGRAFVDGITDDNRMVTEMTHIVQSGLISWGNTAHSTTNTTAAMAFYAPMALNPANSLIAVDGTVITKTDAAGVTAPYEADGVTLYDPAYNTATFAANSLAIVDANAMGTQATLTSENGTLNVDTNASLLIMGGRNGQSLTITKGFDNAATTVSGWGEGKVGKLIFDSRLMAANPDNTGGNFNNTSKDFVVDMQAAAASSVYNKMQGTSAAIFDSVANQGFDVYSQNSGVRFISRLDSQSFNPNVNPESIAQGFESAAQMAQVGAVNKMAVDAIMSAGNATIARNTVSKIGSNAQNVASVHMDESGYVFGGASAGSAAEGLKNGVGLWLMPLYKWNNVNGFEAGNFEHGYTSGLGGIALGADYTFNDMFRVGVSFNVGAGHAKSTGDLSETNNYFDFWGVGLYGAFFKNNFNLVADIGYTKTHNELDQTLPSSMAMSNLNTDVEASALTFGLTAEYVIKTNTVDIIPHAGVRYISVTTSEYDAQNSSGTLFEVEKQTQNVWYFPMGITVQKEIALDNGWTFTPKVDVGAIFAAGELNAVTKANLPGLSGGAELEMQNIDGFAFNGGVGFDIANAESGLSLGLNYNLQAGKHETGHMISATFRYDF